VKHQTRKN